jgi:1-deoxy-D-xylulose-5-phosphate synthase
MPSSSGPISYTNQFGETILQIAKEDPKVVAITAAMPDGTGLTKFSKELPDQYFDVGIAEQHAVTFAAGLAAGGLKPACTIYSTFLQRGWDQVLHDVAIQNLPVRFFMDRAGLVGADGATHHGAFDIGYLRMIPNFVLVAPRDTTELSEMTRFAMNYDDSPIAVRYPRGSADDMLPESRSPVTMGKSETLCEGTDVGLIGYGSTVALCFRAAQKLEELGISTEVMNARFAKPLDEPAIIALALKTGRLIIVEENVLPGGIGEAIVSLLAENNLSNVSVVTLGLPDKFIEHGSQNDLLKEAGITVDSIVAQARATSKAVIGDIA